MNKTIKLAIFTLILILAANIAFAQTPTTATGWFALGKTQYGQKKYEEAINSFSQCIALKPQTSECYMQRGNSYQKLVNHVSALRDYDKVLELNPNDTAATFNHSISFLVVEKLKEDIEKHSKAIKTNPLDYNSYLKRGAAYYDLQQFREALDDFSKVLQKYSTNEQVYAIRSSTYCKLGQTNLAKADEQKVIQLGGKIENPCTAKANQNSGNTTQPVKTQPIGNSRQPTEAEIQASSDKGKALARNLERLIQGKSKEEANNIIRREAGNLMKTDFYAGYVALILTKIDTFETQANFASFDKDIRIAMIKIQRFGTANWLHLNQGKPKPLYPNDVPLPGTSWNRNPTNNSNQSSNANPSASDKKLAEDAVKQGISHRTKCEYQKAVGEFTKAINLDPNNGDYYLERAYAYIFIDKSLAEKDLRKAESLWALETKPQPGDLSVGGQLKYDIQIRRRKEGQSYFDSVFRILRLKNQNALEPDCKEAKNNSANTNQNSGNSNPTDADKKAASEFNKQGLAYRKSCQYQDAAAAFTKAINLYENGTYYHDRAITYLYIDKLKAKADMAKAIELWQAEIDSTKSEINKRADQNALTANRSDFNSFYARLGNKSALEPDCKQASKISQANTKQNSSDLDKIAGDPFGLFSPESLGFPKLPSNVFSTKTAQEWFDLGVQQSSSKSSKYDEAIISFTKAIELNPKNSDYYKARAGVYKMQDKFQLAINDYTKAIELNPSDPRLYDTRGGIYFDTKKFLNAINDFTKAITLTPKESDRSYMYMFRGFAYGELRNFEPAFADLNKAISLQPDSSYFYGSRAKIYCRQGKVDLAKADERKVIELGGTVAWTCSTKPNRNFNDPNSLFERVTEANSPIKTEVLSSPDDLYERAKNYYQKGEYQKALTDMNRAIELDSKFSFLLFVNGSYHLLRGKIYQKTNEHQKAIDDFTIALSVLIFEGKEITLLRSQSYCKIGDKAKALADEKEFIKLGGKLENPCK